MSFFYALFPTRLRVNNLTPHDFASQESGQQKQLYRHDFIGNLGHLENEKRKKETMADNRFVNLNMIREQLKSYLWRDRIVLGGLTVLDGDPGKGKTSIVIDLVSRVTTGRPMPLEKEKNDPAGVVLLAGEDSLKCDVVPNLRAAGADLGKVVAHDKTTALVRFPSDINHLEEIVESINAKFVIIDPITSFLSGSINSDRSVRNALEPLATMADRRNIAILLIRHLTKSSRTNAVYRGAGSIAITGVARSVLIVGDDPACDDKHRHVLALVKSNRATSESIDFKTVLRADNMIGLEWLGESYCAAEDIVASVPKLQKTMLAEAIEILAELLCDGGILAQEVIKLAADAGVAKRTLYRAKDQLRVRSRKIGGGAFAGWMWELPKPNDPSIVTRTAPPADASLDPRGEHNGDYPNTSPENPTSDDQTHNQ